LRALAVVPAANCTSDAGCEDGDPNTIDTCDLTSETGSCVHVCDDQVSVAKSKEWIYFCRDRKLHQRQELKL
jgi:hypothetical protein